MSKIKTLRLLTLFFLISFSINGVAQQKNFSVIKNEPTWLQKIKVVDKKLSEKDIQDGYYLFLSETQTNVETKEYYQHTIREISSGSGVQNGSEISISYDPSYEQLIFHKLVIWRNNKPTNQLNAKKFKIIQKEKELSRFIYSGLFTAYLILDDIRKGDRIEYSYTLKGSNPVFPKFSTTIYFESGHRIVNVYRNLIYSSKREINVKNFNKVPQLKKSFHNGMSILEWQSSMTEIHPDYDDQPSDYDPFGRVQISEYRNWKEIVDWGLRLQKYDLTKSKIINDKVAELKRLAGNNSQKYFELATRFVQDEVRYMGIEIGEYSHRPNTPDKILQQRYGDCKDKSTLLCYLLNANSIKAYSVFLNTYLEKGTSALLPSPTVFNHEVVRVEFDDRNIYIDPTISDQRGSILNIDFPYEANVLIIKPGTSSLTTTPSRSLGKTKTEAVFNVADTVKSAKTYLKIVTTYTHNYANDYRNKLSEDGLAYYEKSYLDFYTETYPGLSLKESLKINDNESENIITVTEHYQITNFWSKEEGKKPRLYTYFYGDLIEDELVTLAKRREAPLYFRYPSTIDQNIKVILPFTPDVQGDNINIDNDYYRFIYSARSTKDTLNLSYYYQSFKSVLPEDAQVQYIKDRKEIKKALSYGIYYADNGVGSSNINYWLITSSVIAFLVFMALAVLIYFKKQAFDLEKIRLATPLGGWLILFAFGIVLAPVSVLVQITKSGLYNQSAWDYLESFDRFLTFAYKMTFIFESIANMYLLAFSILLIPMFFNRRERFPKLWIIYKISGLVILALDTTLSLWLDSNADSILLWATIAPLLAKLLISGAWIWYIIKSERVKATFVFTYPESAWRSALLKKINDTFRGSNAARKDEVEKIQQEAIDITEHERL